VFKKSFVAIVGLLIGLFCGYLIINNLSSIFPNNNSVNKIFSPLASPKHQVIGFLPYWLISKTDKDYSQYLTTLTYFGLTVDIDGTIMKYSKPGESEPGWYALKSGKVDSFFESSKKNNVSLSLLVFAGDEGKIAELIAEPVAHADNLIADVAPIMKQYKFNDLNLDIESVLPASDAARLNFTAFVKQVKKNLVKENLGTLTVDSSATALIKKYQIDLTEVSKIADKIVLMTYDFHYPGSFVTGPVAPIGGAGIDSEFDSETALKEASNIIPKEKIFLGAPLYGYEWETLGDNPRSAVIPGTGIVASNQRVENFLQTCASCSPQIDKLAEESYLIYKDEQTQTYHQIFYPDEMATTKKIDLVNKYQVGGLALWAIGYDGKTILNPLKNYKQD